MTGNKVRSLLPLAVLGSLLSVSSPRPPQFRIVALPAVSDADSKALPTGVNRHGEVVGQVVVATESRFRAVYWHGDRSDTLPTGDEPQALVRGIDDSGKMVGTLTDGARKRRAVLWNRGKLWRIGPRNSHGEALNQKGVAVGMAGDRAFLWNSQSNRIALGPAFSPKSVNDRNEVVGVSWDDSHVPFFQPVLWKNEKLVPLPMGPDDDGEALGINSRSQIVGRTERGIERSSERPNDSAVLWEKGDRRELGRPFGPTSPHPLAIGDNGWIVGYSRQVGRGAHAVLHDGQRFYYLRDLCPQARGWKELTCATAISTDGRIVGYGVFEGKVRGFRLDPIR